LIKNLHHFKEYSWWRTLAVFSGKTHDADGIFGKKTGKGKDRTGQFTVRS